jgi:hypothetical protein
MGANRFATHRSWHRTANLTPETRIAIHNFIAECARPGCERRVRSGLGAVFRYLPGPR